MGRGAAAGGVTSGINYLSDVLGSRKEEAGDSSVWYQREGAGVLRERDPRRGCRTPNPFTGSMGNGNDYGYQYNVPVAGGERQNRKRFSFADFGKEVVTGFVTGGLASAAFYGAGKAVGALKESIKSANGNNRNIPILDNIDEVRYREGKIVNPIEVTYDMRLNPEEYANAVVKKYGINLRGSGQKINIKFDPYHTKGPGLSKKLDPTNIILGPQALISEEELARTISHELNHARSWLKGGLAPEETARAAENALGYFE